MRKAEFKKQAERSNDKFIIYKSLQYRWESNETADPQIGDEEYHFTEAEAIEAAEDIDLDLGFSPMVDRITIDYDYFNEGIDFREQFDLEDLDNHKKFSSDGDTIWQGDENLGKELDPDSIIVFYNHVTYMNYAYRVSGIDFVRNTILKVESDLVNTQDSTSATYFTHFDTLEELSDYFDWNKCVPFNKMQSGSRLVREFLESNQELLN